jgi:hypothetical protein
MNSRRNAFRAVLVAGFLLSQQVFAQQAASKAATRFVPLPKDIKCSEQQTSFETVVGAPTITGGSVKGLVCWISDKGTAHAKEIALVSGKIADGLLETKSFGMLRFSMVMDSDNRVGSEQVLIAIGSDKVQSLRLLLQK